MAQTAPASKTTMSSFRLRLISSAVGLPLLLIALWAGPILVAVVASVAAAIALWEFQGLVSRFWVRPLVLVAIVWAIAAIGGAAAMGVRASVPVLVVGGASAAVVMLLRYGSQGIPRWISTAVGVLYLGLPLTYVVLIRQKEQGLEWLLLAFLGTFATDTSAYFVGKLIGRHKMAPSISPGKTWEGAAGGLLGGALATVGLVTLLDLPVTVPAALLIGVILALVAQAGDLLESKLKRLAGVKESGTLIPGHGGLLDRMDSLVLVIPLIYYVSLGFA